MYSFPQTFALSFSTKFSREAKHVVERHLGLHREPVVPAVLAGHHARPLGQDGKYRGREFDGTIDLDGHDWLEDDPFSVFNTVLYESFNYE